jgi:hypothetical protein
MTAESAGFGTVTFKIVEYCPAYQLIQHVSQEEICHLRVVNIFASCLYIPLGGIPARSTTTPGFIFA